MENKELLLKIKENKDLSTELEKLWKKNATAEQFGETMTKYDVEATNEQVEQLLKELQAIKAKEISSQKIDENQLENIAGGGTGIHCSSTDDCDNHFQDPFYHNVTRCKVTNFCDEFVSELCHESSGTIFGLAK